MKIKSRISLLAILVMACVSVAAAPAVVHVAGGDSVSADFVLADTPTVRYTPDGLSIVAGDVQVVYPADAAYTFTISESAGISSAKSDECIDLSQNSGIISVSGLAAGATVIAYDVNGLSLASAVADTDGTACFNLKSHKGVAIVVTPSKTFKLIIKH